MINSAAYGKVTMEMAKTRIFEEENRTRMQESASTSTSEALVTEKNTRRGRSKSRGPGKSDKNRGKSRTRDIECYHCKKKGHMKRDCYKLKNEQSRREGNSNQERVATTTEKTSKDFCIMYEEDVVNLTSHETSWVIDSGASIHATSRRDLFSSYTSGDYGAVRMGNDGQSKAVGIGDICLETENGTRLVLKGVKHIPDIRLNLISTGKLNDEGFCSTFSDGTWKLTKGSMMVTRGKKDSTLYLMHAKIYNSSINTINNNETVEL